MDHLTLAASDTLTTDDAFVLSRAELDIRRPHRLHVQDFYEMLWVQNGAVRLHTPLGKQDLAEGDLLFICPDQPHGLQGRKTGAHPEDDASMVVSIAIRPGVINAIGKRHDDLDGVAFWSGLDAPLITHRDIRQLATLNQAALTLEASPRRKLYLEAFLMPLLTALDRRPEGLATDAPDWLARACTAAQSPAIFRDGAAGFVAATGRAHPHVSRTMRRFMGITPSEFINAQRMDYAARKLSGTSDPLSEIATDCGIPNLSHFHKLFLTHLGETPQRYRRARQKDLIQPRK